MQSAFNSCFWIIMLGVYRFIYDTAWEMAPYFKKAFLERKTYLLPRIPDVMIVALGIIIPVSFILIKLLWIKINKEYINNQEAVIITSLLLFIRKRRENNGNF